MWPSTWVGEVAVPHKNCGGKCKTLAWAVVDTILSCKPWVRAAVVVKSAKCDSLFILKIIERLPAVEVELID